jgi:sensor histidine kinase YesM
VRVFRIFGEPSFRKSSEKQSLFPAAPMSVADFYSNFIFSDRTGYRLARHVSFWVATVVFFTVIYSNKFNGEGLASLGISLGEALIFLPTHLVATYLVMYWVIPRHLLRGRYGLALASMVGITVFTGLFSCLLAEYGIVPFRRSLGLAQPYNTLMAGFMAGLRGANTVAGFAAAIKLTKYWYHKNQLTQQLEKEKLTAELQLLKAQVHPHFLFNTLNNLYSLTLLKSDHAPEVVLKLSALLRYMLYECNAPQVPLGKEVRMMQDYVELERLRYGDRLDLVLNVRGDLAGKGIAPLLLLPLLENAFKHGASEQLEQAWIALDLIVKDNMLKMKLINGVGEAAPPVPAETDFHGIGLHNVRKRLELLYPGRHELKILREAETFMVTLSICLRQGETRGNETGDRRKEDPNRDRELTLPEHWQA